jgi:hypothetical protein
MGYANAAARVSLRKLLDILARVAAWSFLASVVSSVPIIITPYTQVYMGMIVLLIGCGAEAMNLRQLSIPFIKQVCVFASAVALAAATVVGIDIIILGISMDTCFAASVIMVTMLLGVSIQIGVFINR